MKKLAITTLLLVLIAGLAAAQAAPAPAAKSTRTDGDFVKIIIDKGWADQIDAKGRLDAERMGDYYFFYPVLKAGKIVGYAWWTRDVRIASHNEDILMLINKDGTLQNFWVSASDRHPDMSNDKIKARFFGMDYTRNWNEKTDVITGSTFSSYMYFGEMKSTLLAFKLYILDTGLVK